MADEPPHSRSRKKKHKGKHKREHKREGKRERDDRSSSGSDAEALRPPAWHAIQFQLIDGVNGYAANRQEIDGACIVRGIINDFDMSSFSGLIRYVCDQFQIDSELSLVLEAEVRAPCVVPPTHLLLACLSSTR